MPLELSGPSTHGTGDRRSRKFQSMTTPSVAVLRITLDDVVPRVIRRVVVPGDIRLDRLRLVIQVVMGWTSSHLFEFRIGAAGWGTPDPDGIYDGPMTPERRVSTPNWR